MSLLQTRLSSFGNYEGFRQETGLNIITFVPDANARQGLLPCGFGAGYPACGSGQATGTSTHAVNLDPRIPAFAQNMWPAPNSPVRGGGAALSFNAPNQSIKQNFGTARFDQIFSEKDTLSAVYTIDGGYSLTPGQIPLFGTGLTLQSQASSPSGWARRVIRQIDFS